MGNKEEAKAEFDKARSMTQAADNALVNIMSSHIAHAQDATAVPGANNRIDGSVAAV